MRQETINIYKYEELSDEAKQTARECYSDGQEYLWTDEAMASLEAFLDLFNSTIAEWSLSPYSPSFIRIVVDDEIMDLQGVRAFKWIENNITGRKGKYGDILKEWDGCPLTGYCADYEALESIHNFMKAPSEITIQELLEQSTEAIKDHIISDMEYQDSDEYKEEYIICNEYEFLENGTNA